MSAAVVPLLFLAGCGSSTDAKSSPLDVVTVGGTGKAPTVAFEDKPLKVTATTTKVITAGKGPALTKANAVTFNYVLVNGKDGKQIESSFAKSAASMDLSSSTLLPGLSKGVTGQKVGSRVLVAIPPADAFGPKGNAQAGFGPTDTILFLIDVVSASTPLKTATGDPVTPPAGLPTVKVEAQGVPVVTVPKSKPSAKLVIQPLIKGKGPAVKTGQTLTADFVGVVYETGKVFQSSYKSGNRLEMPVGTARIAPGFDKGIVGQTVGSRVLIVLPPAEGFGKAGNTSLGIKGTDTIIFVVDILAAA